MVGLDAELSFDLPFTQEILSDALGLSVPHLNRMFARLRAEGLIVLGQRRVEFTDLAAIQLLAHFQPITPVRFPMPEEVETP